MKTSQLKQSKFLTKDDCGDGILVTMADIRQENVEQEGKAEKLKWILYFQEADRKPLVLNSTNIGMLEKLYGDETDNWIGKKVVLFNDEGVSFAGEITGGVRVSISRTKAYNLKNAPQKRDEPAKGVTGGKFDDFEGDVPFR